MTELLQPGIRDAHNLALVGLLRRFQALDLSPLLVYHVDRVDASLLPILAEQFAVMGFTGWDLVHTEADRRALVKDAVELHRHKGTTWALRKALERVGWPDVEIRERVDEGLYPEGWAVFEVGYDLGDREVTEADLTNITGVIQEWRPVTRHLKTIAPRLTLEPAFVPRPPSKYDGRGKFDGRMKFDGPGLGEFARVRVNDTFQVPVSSVQVVDSTHVVLHFDIGSSQGNGLSIQDFDLLDGVGNVLAHAHRAVSLLKNPAFSIFVEWPITLSE